MKIRIPHNHDFRINLLCCFAFGSYIIDCALNAVVNLFFYGTWWDTALVYSIILCIILYAIVPIIYRQDYKGFFVVTGFMVVFIATIYGNSIGEEYARDNILPFFITILPFFFLGYSIRKVDMLLAMLKETAKVCTIAMSIWTVVILAQMQGEWINHMSVSYAYLPLVMLHILDWFEIPKWNRLCWVLVGSLNIILLGTRGPMVFLFVFLSICWYHFSKSKNKAFVVFCLLIVGVLAFVNLRVILKWADVFLRKFNIINGGIQKMLYSLDISNGRFELYEVALEVLNTRPIVGCGLYADREILEGYVHLLPLELILNYGYVLGAMLMLMLCLLTLRVIHKSRNNVTNWGFAVILTFMGMLKLMLSGSYLNEPYFYMLLGFLLSFSKRREKHVGEEG